jgi:hypothetical protein
MLRNSVSKRNLISISLGLLALAAMALALVPKGAVADEEARFKGAFTVEFEGIFATGGCAPTDTNCSTCTNNSSVYIEAQGIGDTSLGTLFFKLLKCFNPAVGPFGTYSGTLTATAPNGKDSVTWAYSAHNDNAGDPYGFGPFSGELTIMKGTGKFEGAHGSASFTAASGPGSPGPSATSFVGNAFYSVQGKLGLRDD